MMIFTVMSFIKHKNYYFIQKNKLNNVPEEIDVAFILHKIIL